MEGQVAIAPKSSSSQNSTIPRRKEATDTTDLSYEVCRLSVGLKQSTAGTGPQLFQEVSGPLGLVTSDCGFAPAGSCSLRFLLHSSSRSESSKSSRHAKQSSILGRGEGHVAFEEPGQMALVREAGSERNLAERKVGRGQSLTGTFDALLAEVHTDRAVIKPMK